MMPSCFLCRWCGSRASDRVHEMPGVVYCFVNVPKAVEVDVRRSPPFVTPNWGARKYMALSNGDKRGCVVSWDQFKKEAPSVQVHAAEDPLSWHWSSLSVVNHCLINGNSVSWSAELFVDVPIGRLSTHLL